MLKAVLFDLGDTLQHYKVESWGELVSRLNEDLYRHMVSEGHEQRLPPLDEFLEFFSTTTQAHREDMSRTNRSHKLQEVLELFFKDQQIHDLRAADFMQPWYNRL